MGLRDRDYMRKKPGDDDWRRYDKEMTEAEYGDSATRRKTTLRWLVIGFILAIILIVAVALVVTRS